MKLQKVILFVLITVFAFGFSVAKEASKPTHDLISANQVLSEKVVSEKTPILFTRIS